MDDFPDDFAFAPPEERRYFINDKPSTEQEFAEKMRRVFAMTDEELNDLREPHIERGRE
jgi:hypothetical protein